MAYKSEEPDGRVADLSHLGCQGRGGKVDPQGPVSEKRSWRREIDACPLKGGRHNRVCIKGDIHYRQDQHGHRFGGFGKPGHEYREAVAPFASTKFRFHLAPLALILQRLF